MVGIDNATDPCEIVGVKVTSKVPAGNATVRVFYDDSIGQCREEEPLDYLREKVREWLTS